MDKTYERDTYGWALAQADALRRRSGNELDWENLAEEIESVGKSQANELRSRYITLLVNLLKWAYQPDRRSRSWRNTIKREREEIVRHLGENPGLKPRRDELFASAYATARLDASSETDLEDSVFPETNPFTLAQAMEDNPTARGEPAFGWIAAAIRALSAGRPQTPSEMLQREGRDRR